MNPNQKQIISNHKRFNLNSQRFGVVLVFNKQKPLMTFWQKNLSKPDRKHAR